MASAQESWSANRGPGDERGAWATAASADRVSARQARAVSRRRERVRLRLPVPSSGGAGALPRSLGLRSIPVAVAGGGHRDGRRNDGHAGEPLLLPATVGRRDQTPLYQPGAAVSRGYRPDRCVGGQFLEPVVAGENARSCATRGDRPSICSAVADRFAPRSAAHGRGTGDVAGEGDDRPRGLARRGTL